MFKKLLVTLLSLTLSGTAAAIDFQTLWRDLFANASHRTLLGAGTADGQYKNSAGTTDLSGSEYMLTVLSHGIMVKNLTVEVGLQSLTLKGTGTPGEIKYSASGIKLGGGWRFELMENLDVIPMLSSFIGTSASLSGSASGSGKASILSVTVPLHYQWNQLFFGLRLSTLSGGSKDTSDGISISQSSAVQIKVGTAF